MQTEARNCSRPLEAGALLDMQTKAPKCSRPLEAGQLWRLEHGYVYIVELGKRLIHYKMLRNPNQRAVVTQLIGIEALLRFLNQSEAVLVG